MKKCQLLIISVVYLTSTFAQNEQTQLHGVTFGIGIGPSYLFQTPMDPFLSTDSNKLQMQTLSRANFVISSVITLKLMRLASGDKDQRLYRVMNDDQSKKAKWWEKLSINIGLNLLEINSQNVAFNKSIDGGVGLGYVLKENIHLGGFIDIQQIRQLRDYVADSYTNKRIPNGNDYFNALDINNNNLFFNKKFIGASFKIIFSFANQKQDAPKVTLKK